MDCLTALPYSSNVTLGKLKLLNCSVPPFPLNKIESKSTYFKGVLGRLDESISIKYLEQDLPHI